MNTSTNTRQPAELIELIGVAKVKLNEYKTILSDLEGELVSAVDTRKADQFGSKSFEVGAHKITIDRPLNVGVPAADIVKMEKDFTKNGIMLTLMPFKMKAEFNGTKYKALEELKEASIAYKLASKYVTSKPGTVKVSITV